MHTDRICQHHREMLLQVNGRRGRQSKGTMRRRGLGIGPDQIDEVVLRQGHELDAFLKRGSRWRHGPDRGKEGLGLTRCRRLCRVSYSVAVMSLGSQPTRAPAGKTWADATARVSGPRPMALLCDANAPW